MRGVRKYTSSLSTQLTILMILLISLPTLIFTIFTLQQQTDLSRQDEIRSSYESTVQLATRINSELKGYASVSNLFYLDTTLCRTLLDYREGLLPEEEAQTRLRDLSNRYNAGMTNRTFSTLIVAEDGTPFGNALFGEEESRLSLSGRDWYGGLFSSQTRQLWVEDAYLDSLFSTSGYPNIYLVRKLHDRQDWSPVGTLILIVSQLEIERIYASYVSSLQSLYILDRDMQTVSRVDNLGLGDFPEEAFPMLLSYSGAIAETGLPGAELLSYYTIDISQWKLVCRHDIVRSMQPFDRSRQQYLLLMAVCLVAASVLSSLVIKHYISPIRTLRRQMDEVQKGNLDSHLPIAADNEIGQLTAHFNIMLDSINLLMQRLMEESEAKRSAEIKALQNQINPHFLYNTLASVRFSIFSGEKEKADNIVVSLIHLMKIALSNSQRFITIDMELRLLEDYIRIQQYTFAEPFGVEVDVPPDIRSAYTIKLILQPIVENAIFHGLKPKGAGGLLCVSGPGPQPATAGRDRAEECKRPHPAALREKVRRIRVQRRRPWDRGPHPHPEIKRGG